MRRFRPSAMAALAVGCLVATSGCAGIWADGGSPTSVAGSPTMPTATGIDYQLGGAYDPPPGVGIVARDSTAVPAPGVWSICYINGFQTQPGELDRWSGARADLVLRDASGDPVVDPDWPDEALLDTSDLEKVARIARELGDDLDRCADRGFDAVEIDNLDSFTRSDGRLDASGATALARALADHVHARGLLVGQKNAAEQASSMRETVGFDFAVAEQCVEFAECRAYTSAYGDRVIDIEYPESGSMSASEICADAARPPLLVIRDRDLVAAGSPGYLREEC